MVIKGFGFVQNVEEFCVYKKMSGSSVAFLVLYVDDILLIGNDVKLLESMKEYLNDMRDTHTQIKVLQCDPFI